MIFKRFKTPFSHNIFHKRYAQDKDDTWDALCERLVSDVCGDRSLCAKPNETPLLSREDQAQLVQYMKEMKFIPGGRYLYYAGRPVSFFNNCLTGDTLVMTKDGLLKLDSFSPEEKVEVLTRTGEYKTATFNWYGKRDVYKYEFCTVRGCQQTIKEVKATENHRWFLTDGSVTTNLKIGDVVPATPTQYAFNKEAFIHGLVFGDGNVHYLKSHFSHQLRLCGIKNRFVDLFEEEQISYPQFANGDAVLYITSKKNLKELPEGYSMEYIANFIDGWLSADGCQGQFGNMIHTTSEQAIDFFIQYACYAGLVITGDKKCETKPSNFGERKPLWHIRFQRAESFLGFKVKSISYYGLTDVYCFKEPKTTSFTLQGGMTTGNCFAFKSEEDTREEWGRLANNATVALMSGGGIGNDYSVFRPRGRTLSKTGGIASGPIPLMHMINEVGRNVMQGGSRRSAIYASLNWQHEDIQDFLIAKDWSDDIRRMKLQDFNFPAPLDMTNISINWDTAFAERCSLKGEDEPFEEVPQLWYDSVLKMCQTGEPGHSYNFWENENDTARNAPVVGDTRVLTSKGYVYVKDIINYPVSIWTGFNWAHDVVFKRTRKDSPLVRVSLSNGRQITCSPDHPFVVSSSWWSGNKKKTSLTKVEATELLIGNNIQSDLPQFTDFMYVNPNNYAYGFIFGDGSIREGNLDISYFVENKEEPFLKTVELLNMKLSSSGHRAYGKTGFNSKEHLLNLLYKDIHFIAGWFDADGSWSRNLLRLSSSDKERLYKLQEGLDYLGIKSIVRLDGKSSYKPENSCYTLLIMADSFRRFKDIIPTIRIKLDNIDENYKPYRPSEIRVVDVEYLDYCEDVYCCDVGLPEHSFMAEGVIIGNCTEFTSEDDSDVCNLGSINFGNISSLEELADVVSLASKFLVCGSIRGDLPYDKVKLVREKNRKIGLGLMGVHEWLLQRGYKYEVNDELKGWLDVWRSESEAAANEHCDRFYINRPKKYRAIAPAGTIGILASTTTGIEPIYAVATKRRYLDGGKTWKYEYVIDATSERLIREFGIEPDSIETSAGLARDPERRIKFQYDIQKYVDMAISSTINLPVWGSKSNNETTAKNLADILLKYCHGLRGITVYPDGSRGGQPLTEVSYEEALKKHGQVYAEENTCSGGVCGI